jgi:hypothetical protein
MNPSRKAAADLLGRSAGETVKSVLNEDVVRSGGRACVAREVDGVIEEMVCEVEVSVSACVNSCLSIA